MLVTILYSVFGWISSDTFFPAYNLLKHFFHFSGPHIQLPCCGISFYDFAICASIQLIFPCGFCHSWTNIVFAKVRWSFFFLVENICLFFTHTKETRRNTWNLDCKKNHHYEIESNIVYRKTMQNWKLR